MRFYRDKASQTGFPSGEPETVEVETLDDLIRMMDEFDERLILYPAHEDRDLPLIRVYDDYVE